MKTIIKYVVFSIIILAVSSPYAQETESFGHLKLEKRQPTTCKALGFLDTFLVVSPPPPRMELIVCPGAPAPGFCSHGAGESTAGCIAA